MIVLEIKYIEVVFSIDKPKNGIHFFSEQRKYKLIL